MITLNTQAAMSSATNMRNNEYEAVFIKPRMDAFRIKELM